MWQLGNKPSQDKIQYLLWHSAHLGLAFSVQIFFNSNCILICLKSPQKKLTWAITITISDNWSKFHHALENQIIMFGRFENLRAFLLDQCYIHSKQHQQCQWMWFFTKRYNFFCIGCLAGSGPPSPNKDTPPVQKPKSETKKKWLKLTRKGLLLSSICKVGKNKPNIIFVKLSAFEWSHLERMKEILIKMLMHTSMHGIIIFHQISPFYV